MKDKSLFIWFNKNDVSRNPYAAFRKTFDILNLADVQNAELSIFADTVYKLYVNGVFIGFGPVRFDPRYPQYDVYDLLPYLSEGRNVIAVLANFHGHKVFKSIPTQAAMIAWGSITVKGARPIDLTTGVSPWKCLPHSAYDRYTPKLSFALFAQTHFDQRKFDDNWINVDFDDCRWPDAVVLENQNAFGPLSPREIPFMSLTNVPITNKSRIFPIIDNEDLYSFWMPVNYFVDNDPSWIPDYSKHLAWTTYIYSPCDQTVTAGALYETIWVNNGLPQKRDMDIAKPLRSNFSMKLNEGWNYIFADAVLHSDIYNGYLALPKGKGLIVSTDKNENGGRLFRHTQIRPIADEAKYLAITAPWPPDVNVDELGGWVYSTKDDPAADPCREASWAAYGPSVESVEPDNLNGFVFSKDMYPDGFTMVFDMAYMCLVFPRFVLRGVKGATIDLLYNDRYASDNMHIRQQSWIPLGDRLICSEDRLDFTPIQPRGFKHMSVTVKNAVNDVTMEKIEFISAHYPVNKIGRFECSDPLLNRIWEMCALTQSINMEDAYDDCVDRERGLYTLDTLDQYHSNLACFGDNKLMKRSLELYAQSAYKDMFRGVYPNTGTYTISDFALYAVDGFYSYYMQTGDKKLVETWWVNILKNLNVFNRLSDEREDLLLNADRAYKTSNPEDKRIGHTGDGDCVNRKGVSCMFSCLYLIALRGAEFLAREIGRDNDADEMQRRIAILEPSILNTFWNEEKGAFADNTDAMNSQANSSPMKDFSPHPSLFAVRAGIVPEKLMPALVKSLEKMLTPYFKNGYDPSDGYVFRPCSGYYMLDSMYKAGLYQTAENCIKECWGWFLTQGLVTTPENNDLSQSSHCHAWSANPAYIMSKYMLGVDFNAIDGLDKVSINIKTTENIEWARGVYPHPWGGVKVEWHKENGKIVFDKVTVPEGVVYSIINTL